VDVLSNISFAEERPALGRPMKFPGAAAEPDCSSLVTRTVTESSDGA
jgi:hypothetical protein